MKRLLGMFSLVGVIVGAYFLVSVFTQGHDFKDKSVQLMKEKKKKIITELNKFPGCKDRYVLQSTSFDKDHFFSKTADGRSIYIDKNKNLLIIKWSAEIVDDGRLIIVQPKDPSELQATLSTMMFTSCGGQ